MLGEALVGAVAEKEDHAALARSAGDEDVADAFGLCGVDAVADRVHRHDLDVGYGFHWLVGPRRLAQQAGKCDPQERVFHFASIRHFSSTPCWTQTSIRQ